MYAQSWRHQPHGPSQGPSGPKRALGEEPRSCNRGALEVHKIEINAGNVDAWNELADSVRQPWGHVVHVEEEEEGEEDKFNLQ